MAKERLWEVDLCRGVAVVLMLVSNFIFDLAFFSYMPSAQTGIWPYLARLTASSFLLLVGVSLNLSFGRGAAYKKYLRRGLRIFALGVVISIATRLAMGNAFVVFGILHLIGCAVILAYPFLRYPLLSLLTGIIIVVAGWFILDMRVAFPWLLWLGLQPADFVSVDYVPLFPWFGVVLIGVFIGNALFPGGRRRFRPPPREMVPLAGPLCWLGTHSLLIYFVHQPLFWAGFYLWRHVQRYGVLIFA